jgi:hypothetical protein
MVQQASSCPLVFRPIEAHSPIAVFIRPKQPPPSGQLCCRARSRRLSPFSSHEWMNRTDVLWHSFALITRHQSPCLLFHNRPPLDSAPPPPGRPSPLPTPIKGAPISASPHHAHCSPPPLTFAPRVPSCRARSTTASLHRCPAVRAPPPPRANWARDPRSLLLLPVPPWQGHTHRNAGELMI